MEESLDTLAVTTTHITEDANILRIRGLDLGLSVACKLLGALCGFFTVLDHLNSLIFNVDFFSLSW